MYPLGPWGFAQVLNQTLSNTIPGGVLAEKLGWGCAARFPKPLPYL